MGIHRSRLESWSKWFEAHHLGPVGAVPTLAFEQFTMVLQAVIAGLGVAVAPSFLVQPELASGELVSLFEPIIEKDRGDFFAYSIEKKDFAPVVAFGEWILKEAAAAKEKRHRHCAGRGTIVSA